jgi:hypothetical protein
MLEDSIEYDSRLDSENGADLYTINISGIGTKVVAQSTGSISLLSCASVKLPRP